MHALHSIQNFTHAVAIIITAIQNAVRSNGCLHFARTTLDLGLFGSLGACDADTNHANSSTKIR